MRLSADDLYLLSQCAAAAAYQAGLLIARRAKRSVTVQTKGIGTSLAAQVVTEVDHLSQEIILQTLEPTCAMFDLALLSEERPDDRGRLEKDYFWCIDPLDGTLPFIESVPGYSVSIALVARDGTPLIGVVYDPVEQNLYRAIQGAGAWRNGEPVERTFPLVPDEQTVVFFTDKSFARDPLCQTVIKALDDIAVDTGYAGAMLIFQGGAAMNACQVLEKSPACYFKFPKAGQGGGSVWDYAATVCLFREAGLPAGDIFGRQLGLNPEASTFMNHCGVLYASEPALAEGVSEMYRKLTAAT